MLYYLLYPLKTWFFGFNVLKYITFRSVGAAVTALLVSILAGPAFIRFLYRIKAGEKIRKDEAPPLYNLHKSKEGTPTMGGIIINASIYASVLLWADITNPYVIAVSIIGLCFFAIGYADDYVKLRGLSKKRGIGARPKFMVQALIGLAFGVFLFYKCGPELHFPYVKNIWFNLSWGYLVFVPVVLVGASNAVNITDGLDGLAIGCVIITALVYAVFAYITGHAYFAKYLHLTHIQQSGELAVICAAVVGSGIGFLWYNCHPAQIFMGDTGSLVLGSLIGAVALIIKKEILLLVAGGIFVIEALSVIIQVVSFKTRKKRVFAMSPLHHHFEMKGWPETKITIRFWILAVLFALVSLASLKLR